MPFCRRFTPTPSFLQLALSALVFSATADAGSVITNTWISKSAWYTQTGPAPSNLVLEPSQPYSVVAVAECDKSAATNLTSASLNADLKSIPMFKALSLGENTRGFIYQAYFKEKQAMDIAFPSGSNTVMAVSIQGNTNYYTNTVGADVYPPAPLISIVSNGIWSPQGYIVVLDPRQPLEISWPSEANQSSSITMYSIDGFTGFETNLPNATFSLAPNLIGKLPENTIVPVLLSTWTIQGTFNSFAIFVPPTPWAGKPSILFKERSLLQTGASTMGDYIPPGFAASDYYNAGYGPYRLTLSSPIQASFASPTGSSYETKPGLQAGGYSYDSGPLTASSMQKQFPNGTYVYSTGQRLSLLGDLYPTAPRIISVNGKMPVWTNGMLRLEAGKPNSLKWSAFAGHASFAKCGIEDVSFASACYADWGNFTSQSGRSSTNFTVCPAAGIGGNRLVTNLKLPAHFMETNVNYTMTILYGALTSITNSPCLSGAAFATKTIVPIIAK